MQLKQFFVLWEQTGPGARFDYVHLYDGIRFITALYANIPDQGSDGLIGLLGPRDHTGIDNLSTFVAREGPIVCGTGFGVSVLFTSAGEAGGVPVDDSNPAILTITTAGADYIPAP
jgi:hypothetical protein